jgi:hypothetical protein
MPENLSYRWNTTARWHAVVETEQPVPELWVRSLGITADGPRRGEYEGVSWAIVDVDTTVDDVTPE